MRMMQIVRKDLEREWVHSGERLRIALGSRVRVVGSRIAGRVQVPHPVPPDAPQVVDLDFEPPLTSTFATEGRIDGLGWIDDDSIGWWAEAQDPCQDAARIADAMAGCRAESGFALTDRRMAVIFPEYLLQSFQEARASARKDKNVVGQALSAANDWFSSTRCWRPGEKLVSLWEADAQRVMGWSRFLAGRGFPFVELIRVDFVDGSSLFTLRHKVDYIEGVD